MRVTNHAEPDSAYDPLSEMSQRNPLRVMYWPNEAAETYPAFTQAGGRAAFEAMAAGGLIAALSIYSYRVERAKFSTALAFEQSALDAIRSFRPDILFVQHVIGTDLSEKFWQQLRRDHPAITVAYHEGDPFDRRVKRIDETTILALNYADIVLACGLGSLAEIIAEHSSCRIGYLPHCFVKSRFAQHDPAIARKKHDIVMIANRGIRRRLKFLYVPGGRRRAAFASGLSDRFGTRFGLYGAGWSHLTAARGSLPFFQQEEAIQSGRISANWDHFDTIDYYYSDRLPISLAAGVPHVTTHHGGYDHVFADCPGLYSCRSVGEAIETCRWLLSRSDDDLLAEGLAAKAWAFANMEANIVFRGGYEQAVAEHHRRLSSPGATP